MSMPRGSNEGVKTGRDSAHSSINQRAKSPPRVVQSTQSATQTQEQYCELYLPPQKRKLRQLGLSCSRGRLAPLDQFGPQQLDQSFAITCGEERCRRVLPNVNFDRDTIIIPLDILNLPGTVQIEDFDLIQKLCIVSDGTTIISDEAINRLQNATSLTGPLKLQLDLSTPKVPSEPDDIQARVPSRKEAERGNYLIGQLGWQNIQVEYVTVHRTVRSFKKRVKHKARSAFDILYRNTLGPHNMRRYLT